VALEADMSIGCCASRVGLARVSSSAYHLFIFIEALVAGVVVASSALVVSFVYLSKVSFAGAAIEIRSILEGVVHHVVVWAENLVRSHLNYFFE